MSILPGGFHLRSNAGPAACNAQRRKTRSANGAILAETTASTALLYAFVILLMYVVIEACLSFFIMNGLNQAAREGAREMAALYIRSGGYQTPESSNISNVFSKITVGGIVNDPSQFTAYWPTTYTKNSHPPLTVTVVCAANPGQSGSSSSKKNLAMPGSALSVWATKFSIVGLSMKASATYPLRP
jgi:hypothetical protein